MRGAVFFCTQSLQHLFHALTHLQRASGFHGGAQLRDKASALTPPRGSVSLASSRPVATSQSRTVPSQLPVARILPWGWKANAPTDAAWPVYLAMTVPDRSSPSVTIRGLGKAGGLASAVPVTPIRPSGEQATFVSPHN